MMIVKIAFYKGKGRVRDRFIRWWTKSPYSHAELVLPNREGWIGIYPPESPRVRLNPDYDMVADSREWDFIDLHASKEQVDDLKNFYHRTAYEEYDWIGMILSHLTNYRVKRTKKWYCSEWVAVALEVSGIMSFKNSELYRRSEIPPSALYDMVLKQAQSYRWLQSSGEEHFVESATL